MAIRAMLISNHMEIPPVGQEAHAILVNKELISPGDLPQSLDRTIEGAIHRLRASRTRSLVPGNQTIANGLPRPVQGHLGRGFLEADSLRPLAHMGNQIIAVWRRLDGHRVRNGRRGATHRP